jgi:hypothetical protein
MMQEARAQTESFMARVAREPDAVQAVTDHITSLNFGLAHQHDKVKRLERQVRTIETLKLRLADAISGETLCSNFILDSIGEDFNAARTLRRHTAELHLLGTERRQKKQWKREPPTAQQHFLRRLTANLCRALLRGRLRTASGSLERGK